MVEKTTWTEQEMKEGFRPGVDSNFVNGEGDVIASDGKPIHFSRKAVGGGEYGYPIPVMARDESRANTTITVGQWELSYDSLGYCWRRSKNKR